MDLFSLGNLLAVGLSVGVVMLYRFLDRDNRSLDKVRRYVQAAQRELDSFLQERTQSLKDFSIELQVHENTGKQLIDRVKAAEAELESRATQVEALTERLDKLTAMVENLEQMSGRVDENLNRLREESEFVDKVGRRIKAAVEQMRAIEADIPRVVEQFGQVNDQALRQSLERYQERIDRETERIEQVSEQTHQRVDQFQKFLQGLDAKKQAFVQEAQKTLQETAARAHEKAVQDVRALEKEWQGLEKTFHENLKKANEQTVLAVKKLAQEWQGFEKTHQEGLQKASAQATADLKRLEGEWREQEKTFRQNLQNQAQALSKLSDEVVGKVAEEVRHKAREAQELVLSQFARVEATLKEAEQKVLDKVGRLEAVAEGMDGRRAELEESLRLALDRAVQDLNRAREEAFAGVVEEVRLKAREAQELVLSQFAQVESTFKEFEQDFRYRMERLENVGSDLEGLEANLKRQMDQQEERLRGQLSEQAQLIQQEMERYRNTHHQQVQELVASMKRLDEDLEALKARAYDNVSEKLKVFEDDFFADLQRRDAAMTQSFEELQKRIEDRLLETDQAVARNLEATSRKWQDKLREQVGQLQVEANEQIGRVEAGLAAWREKMESSWAMTQNSTEARLKQFAEDLARTAQEWQKRIDTETARRELALREGLGQVERELENKTKGLLDQVEFHRTDILNRVENTRSELAVWQNRLGTQFKEVEAEHAEQVQRFKEFLLDRINGLKEEFTRQRDDLIFATQEERAALKKELKSLQEEVNALAQSLQTKTAMALEDSRKEYDSFLSEFQRRMREYQAEQDAVIKDFRLAVTDSREKAEALQKKLFGKIEDQYNLLVVNLEEIDKRLKNFVAQTKIFERADSLRAELAEAIEDLKTQIEKIGLQRKDLFEIENQMGRIRKIHEENSERLNRFLAEKKKLEAMDSDFQKVVNLGQTMELRLQQVTASHDNLQQIQYEIRRLEEYAKGVDSQLERLERRRQILETTNESVDRNFTLITQIENRIKELQAAYSTLPSQIEEMQRRLGTLVRNKGEMEAAVQLAARLGNVLTEIEERITKMEKAREWLAGTETRLTELNHKVTEQIGLLSAINKAEKAKSGGAPTNDIRQVVLKLAHQGWTKGDIARVTKLSLSEVELILEMETAG